MISPPLFLRENIPFAYKKSPLLIVTMKASFSGIFKSHENPAFCILHLSQTNLDPLKYCHIQQTNIWETSSNWIFGCCFLVFCHDDRTSSNHLVKGCSKTQSTTAELAKPENWESRSPPSDVPLAGFLLKKQLKDWSCWRKTKGIKSFQVNHIANKSAIFRKHIYLYSDIKQFVLENFWCNL